MPRRYPPEFRRKVLDLLKSGRTVAEVAAALDVTEQTIYNWLGPRAHRYRAKAGAELDRERGSRRRSTSHRRTGDRTRYSPAFHRIAEVGGGLKAVRSDRSDGQGRTTRSDVMPGPGGVGVRLLRVAQSPALGTLIATCLVDAADHRGSHRLAWHLRCPPSSRKNSPLVTVLPWDTAASNY